MQYRDLRDFLAQLERIGELRRIRVPVSPRLEMTEVCDRLLRAEGPAVVFERPADGAQTYDMPVLANLFGTPRRVALGMGAESLDELRDVGRLLSALKEPEPPRGLREAGKLWTMAKAVWDMAPRKVSSPACQEIVLEGMMSTCRAFPCRPAGRAMRRHWSPGAWWSRAAPTRNGRTWASIASR